MKNETIDDIIEDNLDREIMFFLDNDIKNANYKLSILMQNYYTLSDEDYIEYIKENICDRYLKNKSVKLDPTTQMLGNLLKIQSFIVICIGAFVRPSLIIIGALGLGAYKITMNKFNKKQSELYLHGKVLEELGINKWENVLNMYKKEYMEIIKC